MNVCDVMHSPAECCYSETNLDAVAKLMWDHDCGAIPVVDSTNKPIGILTHQWRRVHYLGRPIGV